MALPAAISGLLLSLLIAVTPLPASCEERVRTGGFLIQCNDPAATAHANATGFRASLLPLLAELPSAAAPTGFASLSSNARAFVRGLCFGDATAPSESDCRGCLSAAARNITSACRATTQRAGIWSEGCFVAYADTEASSNAEYAFRDLHRGGVPDADAPTSYSYYLHDWLVANMAQPLALSAAANVTGPRMLATADAATPACCTVRSSVHVLAQCGRDRTAAECTSCLQDTSGALDWDVDAGRRDGGVAAAVVVFNCYLRFNVSTEQVSDEEPGLLIIIIQVLAVLDLALGLYAIYLYWFIGKKMDAHAAPAGQYYMM